MLYNYDHLLCKSSNTDDCYSFFLFFFCVGSTQTFFKGKNLSSYTTGPFYYKCTCFQHDSIIMKKQIKIKPVTLTTFDSVTKIHPTGTFPNKC